MIGLLKWLRGLIDRLLERLDPPTVHTWGAGEHEETKEEQSPGRAHPRLKKEGHEDG